MITSKILAGVTILSLGLLASGVASAKAKFYFNVCMDSSQSVARGGIFLNGVGAAGVNPVLYRPNNLVGLNTQTLTIPDCKNGYVGYMAEVTGKGDYANWKINDGQYVQDVVLVFNLSNVYTTYIVNTAVGTNMASCGDVRISLNFYLTSLTGDYRNFTPDGPAGLIKIVVTGNHDKKTISCQATR